MLSDYNQKTNVSKGSCEDSAGNELYRKTQMFILGDSEYNYPTAVGKVLPVYETMQRHLLNQYEKNLLNTAAQIQDNLGMCP